MEAALEAARQAAEDPVFREENGEGACRRARTDTGRAEELARAAAGAKRNGILALAAGLVLAAAAAVLGIALPGARVPLLAAALVLALGGGAGLLCLRKKADDAARERQAILARYGVETPEAIQDLAEDYRARCGRVTQAEEELDRITQAEKELQAQHYEVSKRIQLIVQLFAPEVSDVFGFSAAISRALTLYEALKDAARERENAQRLLDTVAQHGTQEQQTPTQAPTIPLEQVQRRLEEIAREESALQSDLALAQGRRGAAGDPATLHAQMEAEEEALGRAELDYGALMAAMDALEEADQEMKARFSPELNRCAGAYLRALTGGTYETLTLDRAMDARVQAAQSVTPREVLALSQGTADQLWLAVRLAVCRLALPQDEACPLVLDDALANFDDGRTKLALEVLEQLGRQRQILLFTCHSREAALCREMADVKCVTDPAQEDAG